MPMRESSNMSSPRNGGIPLVSLRGSFFSESFGVIVVGLYVS